MGSFITCHELIDFIDAYLGDELDAATRAAFEAHLAVCPSCEAYLASYRETIDLARGNAEMEEDLATEPPADLIAAVRKVYRR